MTQFSPANRSKSFRWLPVIPLLWLLFALAIRYLDADGLWHDEVWSVYNAGGYPYEPLSPAGILTRIATEDPDQGIVYPLLLAAWGTLAGWTELAARYLSLLAGWLAVAGVYRLGRDTISARAGIWAAALLSVSAFFIYFNHELRVFTIVVLSSALLLWCYWRMMTIPLRFSVQMESVNSIGQGKTRTQSIVSLRFARAGFIVAGVGLTHTHFFGATLLITLGVYHLLFAPKNRSWWRPVFPALMIGVLFLPWLPVFISGAVRASTRADVHSKALTPLPLLETLLTYFGNGSPLFAIILLSAGLLYALYVQFPGNIEGREKTMGLFCIRKSSIRMMALIAVLSVPVMIATNAIFQLIEPARARYLIILWIPLTLVAGMGVEGIRHFFHLIPRPPLYGVERGSNFPSLRSGAGSGVGLSVWRSGERAGFITAILLLVLWFIVALQAYSAPNFSLIFGGKPVPRWQAMTRIMTGEGLPDDLFAFYAGERHYEIKFSFEHATRQIPFTKFITRALVEAEYQDWATGKIQQARRIWYGVDTAEPVLDEYSAMQTMLERDFILCSTRLENERLRFSLYARSSAFCPGGAPQMRFGTGIELTGVVPLPETLSERLTLPLGWTLAPDIPGETYSVAVHLLDSAGNTAAQTDIGLPAGAFVIMQPEIDLSALPPGEYDVYLIVYNWRTLERLPGTHLITGESGDRLRLGQARRHRMGNI